MQNLLQNCTKLQKLALVKFDHLTNRDLIEIFLTKNNIEGLEITHSMIDCATVTAIFTANPQLKEARMLNNVVFERHAGVFAQLVEEGSAMKPRLSTRIAPDIVHVTSELPRPEHFYIYPTAW